MRETEYKERKKERKKGRKKEAAMLGEIAIRRIKE